MYFTKERDRTRDKVLRRSVLGVQYRGEKVGWKAASSVSSGVRQTLDRWKNKEETKKKEKGKERKETTKRTAKIK